MKAKQFFCLHETRLGHVSIFWSFHQGEPKIKHIFLPGSGLSCKQIIKTSFSDPISRSCAQIDVVADQIALYMNGDDISFSTDIICLDLCSAFQRKVFLANYGIPRGKVSTYRRIAGRVGNAKGARAIGTALARNPFPIIIPCHRIIRSDGTLGGFQSGLKMKRALLEMEGVSFDDLNRVIPEQIS